MRFGISLLSPSKNERTWLHIAFWLAFIFVRIYLTKITFNLYSGFDLSHIALLCVSNSLLVAACFFTTINWSHIRLERGGLRRFGCLICVLPILYTAMDAVLEKIIISACKTCVTTLSISQPAYLRHIHYNVFRMIFTRLLSFGTPISLITLLAVPAGIKFALRAYRDGIRHERLAKENLELQLNFLRAQLNPHFLFNTLNNIYGSIMTGKQQRSAEMVSRLSDLLRYVLYDANEPVMPLEKELKIVSDIIALEEARLNAIKSSFKVDIDRPGYRIPPLLLMPLIENAFKFVPDHEQAVIGIDLKVAEGMLTMSIQNTYNYTGSSPVGGIGLTNLIKRLELCYPKRYDYSAISDNSIYYVILVIHLE